MGRRGGGEAPTKPHTFILQNCVYFIKCAVIHQVDIQYDVEHLLNPPMAKGRGWMLTSQPVFPVFLGNKKSFYFKLNL